MTRLLGGEKGEVYQPAQKKEREEPKEFALPPANQTMRRVYAYLLQQRHISREILNAFAQKGLIYAGLLWNAPLCRAAKAGDRGG